MAAPSNIRDLSGVEQWLETLSAGAKVEISAADFEAKAVKWVLEMLPAPTVFEVRSADPRAGTLSGSGEILGEPGTTIELAFSEPSTTPGLLCVVRLQPPPAYEWRPLHSLALGLGGITGTLAPDTQVEVARLDLKATLEAGEAEKLSLPVDLSLPSFEGDWHLSGDFSEVSELSKEALLALAGGGGPAGSLLEEVADELGNFRLKNLEAAVDPIKGTCSLVRMTVGYAHPWSFFDGKFEIEEIDLTVTVFEPLEGGFTQADLTAKMKLGGTPVEIGGGYPDMAVFARLAPDARIELKKVFESLHVTLPEAFPEIDVTALSFAFFIKAKSFEFQLGIGEVALIGDAKLDSFFFSLQATYDETRKEVVPAGTIHSELSFGETVMLLEGNYAEHSVSLLGSLKALDVEALLKKLEGMGIVSVPAALEKLRLEDLEVKVDTGSKTYSFQCEGKIEISGTEIDFAPLVKVSHEGGTFSAEYGGTLTLRSGEEEFEFEVKLSEKGKSELLSASFKDPGGLRLSALAKALDLDLVAVPEALDVALTEVSLVYDLTGGKESLAVGAQVSGHGAAVFVALPPATSPGSWQAFFVLATGGFSLSKLPLVGAELSKVEELSIAELRVLVASGAASAAVLGTVNEKIRALDSGYPQLPPSGGGQLELFALVEAGTEKTPLSVAMGGEPPPPPKPALAAGSVSGAGGGSNGAGGGSNGAGGAAGGGSQGGEATWIDVQKSFGPVSIQRIGAMYQSSQERLWFELDAGLAAGPLTLGLEGLGASSTLKTFSPSFDLRGLSVAYDKPPLRIGGGLANLAPPGADYVEFEGGLLVGAEDLTLQVFGYYGNKPGFSTMFIFGDIEYPLGGPPAFFVTGAALGFGYNSDLRIPTIGEVSSFPLIATLPGSSAASHQVFGPNPTPLTVVEKLLEGTRPWVKSERGALWFAAAVTFTSFELVSGQALVLVDAGKDLTIAVVGTAAAQFPQPEPGVSGGPVYARVELDLLARFAPDEGVFSVQALLAPSSFVLDRACVLTGGFAFFVWFGRNPNAGDFVLTLGGYNSGFVPPNYYPTVPEVGFHWSVDDSITLSGGVYLAITPAVLMVGGRLDATYKSGNLNAWFHAHADVMIRWRPFWVKAGVGITVGVSYKIDVFGLSWTPSIELGCNLEIWGPPTGGKVEVDWYVIGFTIEFGSDGEEPDALKKWVEIEPLLPNAAAPGSPVNVLGLNASEGLMPPPGEPAASTWQVRGGQFAFEATTSVPVTKATVGSEQLPERGKFAVHPLEAKEVSSTYSLTIVATEGESGDHIRAFEITPAARNLPASLWGSPPESGGTPQVPGAHELLVPEQLVGVSLRVKPPTLGASAGSINVAKYLAHRELELQGAQLPLAAGEKPAGDVPQPSSGEGTVAAIADPSRGIASAGVAKARGSAYEALREAGLVPPESNDPMTGFAKSIACEFAAEPLLVR